MAQGSHGVRRPALPGLHQPSCELQDKARTEGSSTGRDSQARNRMPLFRSLGSNVHQLVKADRNEVCPYRTPLGHRRE